MRRATIRQPRWARAPAGTDQFGILRNVVGVKVAVSDKDHDKLNPVGVNAIRKIGNNIVSFGARTLSSDLNFRFIQVRRLLTFIERSIVEGVRFAVFRNNDEKLYGQLTDLIEEFLRSLHATGQLKGNSSAEAFFVKIDSETTTPDDVLQGVLNGEIGVQPQRAAEQIVFKLSQIQSGTSIEE